MWRNLMMGVAAGAVGTVALNVTTYADMAIRGRASSGTPTRMAGILAGKAGISLDAGGEEKAENRKSGVGALFGYMTGLGVGAAYGLLRPSVAAVPASLAGVGVGLAAMAASDVPMVSLGVSDPSTWGVADWSSDIVPHLVYGLVVTATFDAFTDRGN